MDISRRDFLKICGKVSLMTFGTTVFAPEIAEGFMRLAAEKRPMVGFVQGQCCTGCTTSLAYGNEDSFLDFLTGIIRLQVHPNLSFSQGHDYLDSLKKLAEKGNFYLVCEGSIPEKMKKACMIGEETYYDFLPKIASGASAIITSGTCASYGGIPASNQNVTGALPIDVFLQKKNIKKPLIKIPGCPVNPDRIMGTVAYIVATGKLPKMVDGTPEQYFGDLIHNHCGRFQFFTQGKYVEDFSKDKHECLLKVGCRGPIVKSDCATRRWNGKMSVCVESNSPCVGCVNKDFPFRAQMYTNKSEILDLPWIKMRNKGGKS